MSDRNENGDGPIEDRATLREIENAHRLIRDGNHLRVIRFDVEGRVLFVNKKAAESLGWPPGGSEGRSIYDMFAETVADFHMERFAAIMAAGVGGEFEDSFELAQGKRIIVSDIQPLKDGRGRIVGVETSGVDVTDLRKAQEDALASEAELRKTKECYERLIDNADEAIVTVDANGGRMVYMNAAAERLSGYSMADCEGDDTIAFRVIQPEYAGEAAHEKRPI